MNFLFVFHINGQTMNMLSSYQEHNRQKFFYSRLCHSKDNSEIMITDMRSICSTKYRSEISGKP